MHSGWGYSLSSSRALRTLLLCTSALAAVVPATASSAQGTVGAAGGRYPRRPCRVGVIASTMTFEIAPGKLSDALTVWAKTSGLKILAPTDKIKNVQTAGATGRLTAADALHQLLSGTELDYRMTNERHVTIFDPKAVLDAHAQAAGTLPTVEVTEAKDKNDSSLPPVYAGGQVARGASLGVLGNRGIMDAPFNRDELPPQRRSRISRRARLRDVIVQNDPSVRSPWSRWRLLQSVLHSRFSARRIWRSPSTGSMASCRHQLAGTAFVERAWKS